MSDQSQNHGYNPNNRGSNPRGGRNRGGRNRPQYGYYHTAPAAHSRENHQYPESYEYQNPSYGNQRQYGDARQDPFPHAPHHSAPSQRPQAVPYQEDYHHQPYDYGYGGESYYGMEFHPRGSRGGRGGGRGSRRAAPRSNGHATAQQPQPRRQYPQADDNWQRNSGQPLGESANRENLLPVVSNPVQPAKPNNEPAKVIPETVPSTRRLPAANRGSNRGRNTRNDDRNQRERLIDDLTKERLECQFCYDRVWAKQQTWSCDNCFNVFHLKCVRGWANSCKRESDDDTWRCMICQSVFQDEPKTYWCFCRKHENPEMDLGLTPHSCGETCAKNNTKPNSSRNCPHPCTELCHPGPCPPCHSLATKPCACGRTTVSELCSIQSVHVCSSLCGKRLNCGRHTCSATCHPGDCEKCSVMVEIPCFCGKDMRSVPCMEAGLGEYASGGFACAEVCGRRLGCENHGCQRRCHAGECGVCPQAPEVVTTCPCGKMALKGMQRRSCLEPVPTCVEVCGKRLECGTAKNPHFCEKMCHEGPCGACGKKTAVTCLCGSSTQVVPCAELTPEVKMWHCTKKCQKKMLCGRHKCDNICCNFDEHVCLRTCGKRLTCGLHNCEDPCGHPGFCRRCYNTSFEERTCRCGRTVQHPPIPCGAALPDCPYPCSEVHACGHPPTHNCHGDEQCPACTFLCEKVCFCGHETRKNVPCFTTGISCGKACGKPLECGVHACRKICHSGECQPPGEKCAQLCPVVRKCGHPCGAPCHGKSRCPNTSCKANLAVSCECKLRQKTIVCYQHDKLLMDYLRRKQGETGAVKTGDLESLRYMMPTDILECDEECRRVERNKNLAAALKIDEHVEESSAPCPPVYSEDLKKFAREHQRFATQLEQKLMSLVETVKKCATRKVHNFEPMKFDQRKFAHELAGFYGCETKSYDDEPIRSIIAVARPDSVMLPVVPLYQVVQAEKPVKQTAKFPASVLKGVAAAPVPVEKERSSGWPTHLPVVDAKKQPVIDYFDFEQ
ncbi:transcriptional repressor NF-X1-like [Paramacrobiotus metropolitanus]|uniref:transcriptional repressor NF-X1-like n=1 Tax=Paramacrobiotus metropolitanus TaxID=2943436 RepID=UPI0024456FC1|nr:transcriptional repressor NF-X1-like [Paramacrobiotus metropolitanus]